MKKYLLFIAISIIFSPAFAQITITSADVFNLIGSPVQIARGDILDEQTIPVDIGSAGENQLWDFSDLTFPSVDYLVRYLSPQETPYFSTFPTSNFVQKISFAEDTLGFNLYHYMKVSSDTLRFLGMWIQEDETEILEDDSAKEFAPLPLTYGTSWIINHTDTIGTFPGGFIIETDDVQATIDAWGSITIPAGTFDCLRLHTEWESIERWIVEDIVTYIDTSYGANISWISLNSMELVNFNFEYEGQTPQYTQADEASLVAQIGSTGDIEYSENSISGFQLQQNYPNPFNPLTTIGFTLPVAGRITIDVININGQKVATILDDMRSIGTHYIQFDAGNLASGVYLYRLKSGSFMATKKMIVIR